MRTTTMQIVMMRVKVVDPPVGVVFALQAGSSSLVGPLKSEGSPLSFDFTLNVADTNLVPVRLTGPFAQGPAAAHFVYLCSGVRAGRIGSCWDRRAKVPLNELKAELVIEAMERSATAVGTISGIAKDGGPVCASVKLMNGWDLL